MRQCLRKHCMFFKSSRWIFFQIVLPTGGNVLINKNGWLTNFINIDITPSAYDFGITEGLCGILDENRANDFQKRKGSRSTDPNLSWR